MVVDFIHLRGRYHAVGRAEDKSFDFSAPALRPSDDARERVWGNRCTAASGHGRNCALWRDSLCLSGRARIMRRMKIRTSAWALVAVMSMPGVSVMNASAAPHAAGTVSGTAVSSANEPLANTNVRLRSLQTGKVAATTVTDAAGRFSVASLNPDTCVIELLNAAGQIIGTSTAISVTPGAAITGVAVTSSVAAAVGAHPARFSTTLAIVTAAAASAAVAGVTVPATSREASVSR